MVSILIDIGNSSIKACISVDGVLSRHRAAANSKVKFQVLFGKLLNEFREYGISSAYVSSLDKTKMKIIAESVKKKTGAGKTHFVSAATPTPLLIDYEKSLGSDRICSALGAVSKYPGYKNILVLDFGTATTVNFISNGVYKGGMIAAGLVTSARSLNSRTTLPRAALSLKADIENRKTKNAIASGLILQQVFFAEKTIEVFRKKYKRLFTVCTGGNLAILKKYLASADAFDANLVIEGLNTIMRYNENIRK